MTPNPAKEVVGITCKHRPNTERAFRVFFIEEPGAGGVLIGSVRGHESVQLGGFAMPRVLSNILSTWLLERFSVLIYLGAGGQGAESSHGWRGDLESKHGESG